MASSGLYELCWQCRAWHKGRVTAVDVAAGTCDVHYDDGDKEEGVRFKFVRELREEEGGAPRLLGAWPGAGAGGGLGVKNRRCCPAAIRATAVSS